MKLPILSFVLLAFLVQSCTSAYEVAQNAQPNQAWGGPSLQAGVTQPTFTAQANNPQPNNRGHQQAFPAPTDGVPNQRNLQSNDDYFSLIPETSTQRVAPATFADTDAIQVNRAVLLEMRNTIDALLMASSAMPAATPPSHTPSQPTFLAAQTNQPVPPPIQAEDPNLMMQQQLNQRVQQAQAVAPPQPKAQPKQAPPSYFERPPVATAPVPPSRMVALNLPTGQVIQLDESLLIEWEQAIKASKRGESTFTELPAWLMQGLEWLTHAPTEEPGRSQTILPLYRSLEQAGYLQHVQLNNMSSRQIVAVLRFFLDDVKRNQGALSRG